MGFNTTMLIIVMLMLNKPDILLSIFPVDDISQHTKLQKIYKYLRMKKRKQTCRRRQRRFQPGKTTRLERFWSQELIRKRKDVIFHSWVSTLRPASCRVHPGATPILNPSEMLLWLWTLLTWIISCCFVQMCNAKSRECPDPNVWKRPWFCDSLW